MVYIGIGSNLGNRINNIEKAKYFLDGVRRIYDGNIKSNGEFYIDNIFNTLSELDIKIFDVEKYHCWGTPEELKKYEN